MFLEVRGIMMCGGGAAVSCFVLASKEAEKMFERTG